MIAQKPPLPSSGDHRRSSCRLRGRAPRPVTKAELAALPAGAAARRCRSPASVSARLLLLRRVAHAESAQPCEVAFSVNAGGQLGCRLQRQLDRDLAAIGLDLAEELVFLASCPGGSSGAPSVAPRASPRT